MGKRCIATTREGKPCRAWATEGSDFCLTHGQPEKVREAGRRGGQAAREKAVLTEANFTLASPQDVTVLLRVVCNSMLTGQLDRGLASTAAYIGATLLKALEVGALAERIAALEERMGRTGK